MEISANNKGKSSEIVSSTYLKSTFFISLVAFTFMNTTVLRLMTFSSVFYHHMLSNPISRYGVFRTTFYSIHCLMTWVNWTYNCFAALSLNPPRLQGSRLLMFVISSGSTFEEIIIWILDRGVVTRQEFEVLSYFHCIFVYFLFFLRFPLSF